MTRLTGIVEKGWGFENIWATNDKYCAKLMNFKEGARFSMHFHAEKMETWYVLNGIFEVEVLHTNDASISSKMLYPGQVHHNDPLVPHRLICHTAGTILEVSTPDSVEDNYRVMPGDSQKTLS
ncbi:Mannose-6-phosphate isomerase, type II, C-terminal [uncultured Caudovirales phage]|uniref:Mannose-6-phosphate isomerase, type II, C-terminal n=1 Tax=uncultured Caudovirales phage TaxID=2100421 RepID=A0A6J5LN08_9CAUD|nr:Mannose-6-phosphate isomerase, type II, C-terminal [uncultured Caudovirales phage]